MQSFRSKPWLRRSRSNRSMACFLVSRGWTRGTARALAPRAGDEGLTLIELIVAFSLMLILSAMALPVARVKIQREKERRLRIALAEIRTAIDRHKDMADAMQLGELDPDNHGYPESLEVLVEGVELTAEGDLASLGIGASGLGGSDLRESNPLGDRSLSAPGDRTRSRSGIDRDDRRDLGGSRSSGLGQPRSIGSRDSTRGGLGEFREDGSGNDGGDGGEKVRFLRSIPMDPMTGKREWGMQSVSDSPMARSWNGRNVFDIYSLSPGIALDGTSYGSW